MSKAHTKITHVILNPPLTTVESHWKRHLQAKRPINQTNWHGKHTLLHHVHAQKSHRISNGWLTWSWHKLVAPESVCPSWSVYLQGRHATQTTTAEIQHGAGTSSQLPPWFRPEPIEKTASVKHQRSFFDWHSWGVVHMKNISYFLIFCIPSLFQCKQDYRRGELSNPCSRQDS